MVGIIAAVSQAGLINTCFHNSAKCDYIIIINGGTDPFVRYGVFLADSVIDSFISLILQLIFSFYLFPIFACILVYYIIHGHYIFLKKTYHLLSSKHTE